jgi:hypothetical protein
MSIQDIKSDEPSSPEDQLERTLDAVARAYGLLWAVTADNRTRAGSNVQKARRTLLQLLTRESQRGGIAMLREGERPTAEGWL